MKSFDKAAFQGDMLIRRIDKLPDGVQPKAAIRGRYELAHSESGHSHVVMERPEVKHFSAMDEFRSYLVVENIPVELKHERDHDTHESLEIKPGVYEIVNQREFSPEGFRRAID